MEDVRQLRKGKVAGGGEGGEAPPYSRYSFSHIDSDSSHWLRIKNTTLSGQMDKSLFYLYTQPPTYISTGSGMVLREKNPPAQEGG